MGFIYLSGGAIWHQPDQGPRERLDRAFDPEDAALKALMGGFEASESERLVSHWRRLGRRLWWTALALLAAGVVAIFFALRGLV